MEQNFKKYTPSKLVSDAHWELLRPILFRVMNTQGPQKKQDDRAFIAAIAYLIKTRSSWRQLPPEFGNWHTVYMRFRRWEKNRIWAQLWLNMDDRARSIFWLILEIERDMSDNECESGYRDIRCRIRKAICMEIW